jgi:DNA replication and repair protein RecF
VYLAELRTRGFRNLADAELSFPPEGIALVGANAQGKSNLLEAIYYLEILRSFRGAADRELVRFGEEVFRVSGRVRTGKDDEPFEGDRIERTVAAAWQRTGSRKKVTLDDQEPERLADGVGHVGAVLFTPSDLALVNEGPSERRRFLNILLSLNEEGYLAALQRYRQVLSQRNAALREGRDPALARAWDPLLVREGARILECRGRWIESFASEFTRVHGLISGGGEAAMTFEPSLGEIPAPPWEESRVAEAYAAALEASRDREERQRTTVVGPHRDELVLSLEGSDGDMEARSYGSGGQRRSLALTLRLLEAETIRRRKDREPLLLMDDVFAELDEDRSDRLMGFLDRTAVGQVILTAPRKGEVRMRRGELEVWGIESGEVRR